MAEDGAQSSDETAVNHEIATLLLNLASRTHSSEKKQSSKPDPDVAMDLSNYAKSNPLPSHSPKLSSSTTSFQTQAPSSTNPYSLFPMSPTTTGLSSIPSSYLLQNLLIGKMQQQLSSGSDRVSTTVSDPAKLGISQHSLNPPIKPINNAHSNIPLLSGQIVAQLNALLFSIHGLTDKNIEAKVEGQLAAIFTRLQEIVALVQLTKGAGKEVNGTQESEEQKLSRQLEEFQHSVNSSGKGGKSSSSLSPVENTKLDLGSAGQKRLVPPFSKEFVSDSTPQHSRKSTSSRDSNYAETSPPEKRVKMSPDDCSSSSSSAPPRKTSKGGKGIRNRVFCGDCPGCLKNDDCGQCRYCRDKTKFGGQNRLRQKCLHRRCQMDTHRRAGQQSAVCTPEPTIYSGVELARLTSHNEGEDRPAPFSSALIGKLHIYVIYPQLNQYYRYS